MVAKNEPQATAVKLAQLGGGVQGASCPLHKTAQGYEIKI